MSSNNELIEILKTHCIKYPDIQPDDVIKLIYQNEFAGGHIIPNTETSLAYLCKEYNNISHDFSQQLFEEIGNNIVRVNLHALDASVFSLEKLNEIFVKSSENHKGNMSSFIEKLNAVEEQYNEIGLKTDKSVFSKFLEDYKALGCPAIHHSEIFRELYAPAYRVVDKTFLLKVTS